MGVWGGGHSRKIEPRPPGIDLNSFNAETSFIQSTRTKIFLKKSKPGHVGIHWNSLAECSQMPGSQLLFRFMNPFLL